MVTLYLNPPGTLALIYMASYFMACIESSVYDCIMFALQHMKFFFKKNRINKATYTKWKENLLQKEKNYSKFV